MATVLGEITIEDSGAQLVVGNRRLQLRFAKDSGAWVGWRDLDTGTEWLAPQSTTPSLTFRIGGTELRPVGTVRNSRLARLEGAETIGAASRYVGVRWTVGPQDVTVAVESEAGEWRIAQRFTLQPGSSRFRREVEIAYHGQAPAQLRDVHFIVPEVQTEPADGWTVEAPGYRVQARYPLERMPPGEWGGTHPTIIPGAKFAQHDCDAPGSKPGLIALHHAASGRSLLCWGFSLAEPSLVAAERNDRGVRLVHHLLAGSWINPGDRLRCGTQTLASYHGAWHDALRWFQTWWAEVGIVTPSDRPAWAHGIAIYEVHIGTAPFIEGRKYAPYPTMADLTADLPRLRALGFNAIQIMPHHPFPGYTVHDFYDVATTYGGDAELKEMVAAAHSLGLRVLLDIITHGCVDKAIVRWQKQQLGSYYDFILNDWLRAAVDRSPYLDEHPEWFMRDEAGAVANTYTAAFDHANADWHEFMIGALSHYLRAYDVDGFRMDAPTWNCMPNWDRAAPYRGSVSMYGAGQLLAKARPALRAVKPDVLLYTEPSGPLFRRDCDLVYNYDEQWIFTGLVKPTSPRGFAGDMPFDDAPLTARDLLLWLDERRRALPSGSVTVHHLDSHDTFWWGEKAQLRREAFGRTAANALFAWCAWLDGGVMNYAGGEGEAEDFYRRALHLRHALPELRGGECDYLAVEAAPADVLAWLWRHDGGRAVPLIHLADTTVTCRLRVPLPAGAATYTVWDAMQARWPLATPTLRADGHADIALTLRPYEAALLVIRPVVQRTDERG